MQLGRGEEAGGCSGSFSIGARASSTTRGVVENGGAASSRAPLAP